MGKKRITKTRASSIDILKNIVEKKNNKMRVIASRKRNIDPFSNEAMEQKRKKKEEEERKQRELMEIKKKEEMDEDSEDDFDDRLYVQYDDIPTNNNYKNDLNVNRMNHNNVISKDNYSANNGGYRPIRPRNVDESVDIDAWNIGGNE